ncbi:MAG: hypothetical protein JJT99_09270 [Rhodobacteraceae bacterium]|nr:hypothetical protein [Paracoccaceae bacterium]
MTENKETSSGNHATAEVQRALALPTLVTNRFIVHAGQDIMRVAFGEQVLAGQDTNMHVAVSMSTKDWLEFARLIERIARDVNQNENADTDTASKEDVG